MSDPNPFDVTRDQQKSFILKGENEAVRLLERIGRYRIQKLLGKGGFGLVYLAEDEQLNRLVAVKVPHARLISKPQDAEAYLAEARAVANLDHPGIVPVHDVGSTSECPCYIVSKYIQGTDLATKLRQQRLRYREAAELVAALADALHYAHKQGLVHRDVKPGNILIANHGRPYIVDFGLALREENLGKGPIYAGTPAYMSPEQARGEGHRVDGRSDVFSLGVVFYELLAGRQPFRGDTQAELFEQVTSYEAKPLRQYDERLPKELERICHKAMAKRASERYSSAHDLAEDLRHFLAEQAVIQSGTSPGGIPSATSDSHSSQSTGHPEQSVSSSSDVLGLGASHNQPIRIVPKGLRSFNAHDADFFLELLPGPRDRAGLPDSLQFWKTRIEETDPDNTFTVGLIYGPSGCGKSSLVKAGLLPRLSEEVISVYIEATPEETETRLLHGLRKRCPGIDEHVNLKDALAALRRGQGIPVGKKVLIVLDQFEQWLHVNKEEESSSLVQALRQCDGGRVQCILMVRDDFWLAVSRFLRELEVRLVEGHNIALADLFDLDHARKVLAAFGRAFGKLPDDIAQTSRDQKEFLKQSVAGLAEEGKVICVRLALFAEMMKSKEWTPAALKEVGGTKGVGVTFLEETFSSATASPPHRFHQKAARAVLSALLPDSGTDIKGYMRSNAELLEASAYGNRPRDFDDLIRILDGEIRLITPTDPEGRIAENDHAGPIEPGQKYYQLTHDYLVHSLRDWLTRKQKETRRGRAELKLSETAATWNAKPENRFLPTWLEDLSIRLLTDRKKWTEPQRRMMAKAGRVHGSRTGIVALLLVGITLAGGSVRRAILDQRSRTEVQLQEKENATRAEGLVASLLSADFGGVPAIIAEMKSYSAWADPILRARLSESEDGSPAKLALALALLPFDNGQIEYLKNQLPACTLEQFPLVCGALYAHGSTVAPGLWNFLQDDKHPASERFQAACALATFAPDDDRWQGAAPFVSGYLVNEVPTLVLGQRLEQLRPARKQLESSLSDVFRNHAPTHAKQGVIAATALASFLSDAPDKLVELILEADNQLMFSPLLDALRPSKELVVAPMTAALNTAPPPNSVGQEQERFQTRRSLAAVTLVQLGFGETVWPLLQFKADPSLRSHLIHSLSSLQTNPETLMAQLAVERSLSVRSALIEALGGLDETRLNGSEKQRIIEFLTDLYVTDHDPGIHAAAFWAIRRWGGALPPLPPGLPAAESLSEQRVSELAGRAAAAEAALKDYERESQTRMRSWEQLKRETPMSPPATPQAIVAAFYPLDRTVQPAGGVGEPGDEMAALQGPGSPNWCPGVSGDAIEFDGQGGFISTGLPIDFEHSDQFSYGCWFWTTQRRPMALLSKMETPEKDHRGFDILVNEGVVQAHIKHIWPTSVIKVVASPRVDDGAWHHVQVTYDGSSKASGLLIFIDGKPAEVEVVYDTLNGSIRNTVPFLIGSRGWSADFAGAIDDVWIGRGVMPPEEVRRVYESGVQSLAGVAVNDRTAAQTAALYREFCAQDQELLRLRAEVRVAERARRTEKWNSQRRWMTNSQRQHLVIVPIPADSAGESLDYSFAMGTQEVTVEQFVRFRQQHQIDSGSAGHPDCPAHLVSWFDAAAYCNWLSEVEGIPREQWCYEPNLSGDFGEGMKLKADYLKLTGYRLPTLDEWEFCCRAGTTSRYHFGESQSLLDFYGWHAGNAAGQSHPVGSLLPNELGLFDMHGNVWEWCQNGIGVSDGSVVSGRQNRHLAGGAYSVMRGNSIRTISSERPSYRGTNIGFRLARTLP